MIAQRPPGSAPAIQAEAENLPFADDSFDAAMAILTLHHWREADAGLAEMVRVAERRVVLVGFDVAIANELWTVRDYLPELMAANARTHPSIEHLLDLLPGATVHPLLVPNDCTDRMFATLWARPEQHLDAEVRAGTSAWDQVPREAAERALWELRRDLESGRWDERYGHLRQTSELDVGLRLLRAELKADP